LTAERWQEKFGALVELFGGRSVSGTRTSQKVGPAKMARKTLQWWFLAMGPDVRITALTREMLFVSTCAGQGSVIAVH
jgi:hypothetical protein